MTKFASILALVAGSGVASAAASCNTHWTSPVLCGEEHQTCSKSVGPSCGGDTDTCCQENSYGIFMGTQFWDYSPAAGPADLFTTHGLWSNKCAGGYGTYCNPDWEVENVTEILLELGEYKLLDEMNWRWKNGTGSDEDLWVHEYNKHGTCMATVNPACYKKGARKYQNVVDYFTTAVKLQQKLPTFQYLAKAGIHPSTTTSYKTSDVQAALVKSFGYKAALSCDATGALTEVWYYFSLTGAVANGKFTPNAPQSTGTTCGDKLWFVPKGKTAPSSLPVPTPSS